MEALSAELSQANKAHSALAANDWLPVVSGAQDGPERPESKVPWRVQMHDIHAQGYDHDGVTKHHYRLLAHPSCIECSSYSFCTRSV